MSRGKLKNRENNMTKIEIEKSGCLNKHCKFILTNGQIESGVIETFFPEEESEKYFLVRSPKMEEFQKYMIINDNKKAKELCVPINLENIKTVERIGTAQ
jgi:hypothetical protein